MAHLHFVSKSTGDDGSNLAAFEGASVEGGVARFAGRLFYVVGPFVRGGKNREVGGLARGDFSFDAEDARGAASKQFDHAHERQAACVDELFERKSERGFEAEDSEGSAVELDVFECGFVRRVIRGNGVNGAVGKSFEESFAVFAGG